MKRFRQNKRIVITKGRLIFFIVLMIVLNLTVMLYYFTSKLGEVLLTAAEKELREITTLIVNSYINQERLSRIGVEDLIIARRNQAEEITDIDFKLDIAYEMFLELKDILDLAVLDIKNGKIKLDTTVVNDRLIIKVPFYSYTNNPLLMNLGPDIYVKVNLIEHVRGSITTEVTSYGINTALVNLYLNLFVTESILFPVNRENIVIEYNILLASKVIQGKVPSFYTGKYETSSDIINLE